MIRPLCYAGLVLLALTSVGSASAQITYSGGTGQNANGDWGFGPSGGLFTVTVAESSCPPQPPLQQSMIWVFLEPFGQSPNIQTDTPSGAAESVGVASASASVTIPQSASAMYSVFVYCSQVSGDYPGTPVATVTIQQGTSSPPGDCHELKQQKQQLTAELSRAQAQADNIIKRSEALEQQAAEIQRRLHFTKFHKAELVQELNELKAQLGQLVIEGIQLQVQIQNLTEQIKQVDMQLQNCSLP